MMRWNNTKTYTEEDMMRMQQEAIRRVREMQAQAQAAPFVGRSAPEPTLHPLPPIEAESRVINEEQEPSGSSVNPSPSIPQQHSPGSSFPLAGLLDKFNVDSETLLILGLIFLLYNEKADMPLLFALGYLLL